MGFIMPDLGPYGQYVDPLDPVVVSLDLLNIVNHTIHQSLCIHLGFSSHTKAVKPLRRVDITDKSKVRLS